MDEERFGPLVVQREPGLAVVTIDHPPTNLVDGAFTAGLVQLLDALDATAAAPDPVRAVVFRSADPDFFLMHGDVEQILRMPTGTYQPVDQPNPAAATFLRLSRAPYVSIGLVDGAARGGGCEFLSALDLRYGTERTIIGQPEVPMGILPGAGGTARLPRLLGRDRALELILTGRDLDADEALAVGWLTARLDRASIDAEVMRVARRIAAMPAASVAEVKRVVDVSLGGLDAALVEETNAFFRLVAAGTHLAPMRRFLDAGGQTRAAESGDTSALIEAMLAAD